MKVSLILYVTTLIVSTIALPSGAPSSACDDMVPQHGVDPQKSSPPYTISISSNHVKGGDRVTITITGKTPSDKFKGFLTEARCDHKRVGEFIISPVDVGKMKLLACDSSANIGLNTAVTHVNRDDKDFITLTWIAPKFLDGTVVFRNTIARSGYQFWVNVESEPVRVTP